MVLQLVLPIGPQTDSDNYVTSNNDILLNTFKERKQRSRKSSSTGFEEISSTSGQNGYTSTITCSSECLEMRNNIRNISTNTLDNISSSVEEKNKTFREHFTKILSSIYALFIVTVGLIIYVSDVILGNSPIAEIFSLYIVIIAFVFLTYLIIDVRIYMNREKKLANSNIQSNQERRIDCVDNDLYLSITVSSPENTKFTHYYCLHQGRHSGNFYLKLGAAGFCLGHLVHSGLLLGYQIVFLTSDGNAFFECASVATLTLVIIYPIYSFLLLYFIFKYSNLIINRHVPLVRFGLMHCIASSLCFWLWTILRETIDSLSSSDDGNEEDYSREENFGENTGLIFVEDNPIALPLTSYNKKGATKLVGFLNNTVRLFTSTCEGDEGLSLIYQNYSPYLYPFTVEYSILVVGVLVLIWQSIGKCDDNVHLTEINEKCKKQSNSAASNVVLHADFHSANKGLFGGIIIMVTSIVSIILFFIALNDSRFITLGLTLNALTEIVFSVLMAVTCIFAYRQITKLDVNKHNISLLDDSLLFFCIPAFFVDAVFSFVAAVQTKSSLTLIYIIVQLIQILVQTPLIIDGLRRCSNSKSLKDEKPGRELVTFLVVCNVAMWITQTFEIESHGLKDHRYEFYGKVLWTIIGHMTVPLMMFYRFHSSVCLVDIWKFAYEPATH